MRINLMLFLFCTLAFMACKINKKPDTVKDQRVEKVILEEVLITPHKKTEAGTYHPAEKRIVDLLHTRLEVSFDYSRQWVYGKATLWMKPYFHSIQSVELDAKGFTINQIGLIHAQDTLPLWFKYDSTRLYIKLPILKSYKDTFVLYIDYIAKPNELANEGGYAITDSRGIYFVNPMGTDPNKPREIWTQGETHYNSCWFPTNDVPNEKHTQDIFITLDDKDVSLSNGLWVGSVKQKNGKRTDHWQQLKPHAPYLTMLVVGEFSVVRDQWHGMEVSYYVEPKYEPYARMIFGKTPQMIDVFSKLTGVDYPWDKFSQIVCRDFVSGAMENTSAVLHYEAVQHDAREHLDNPHEDIIVHELFHHWFGDYVTCNSWSNLPLNESFATYGEYLWNEYTYGKQYADMLFSRNLDAYLRSKSKHGVSPIRTVYKDVDELFDVVSYQKGSWIIHTLRKQIGDAAFFRGLNLYLTQNKFGTADIHHLRHAMEQASGEDLNLFFTQWFLGKGHPELAMNYYFDKSRKKLMLEIKQVQDSSFGLFNIPTQLSYAFDNGNQKPLIKTINIDINSRYELISIDCENEDQMMQDLALVYLDPNGNLLGTIKENKSPDAWLNQLMYGESYLVKQRALRQIMAFKEDSLKLIVSSAIEFFFNREEYYYKLNGILLLNNHEELFGSFENKIVEFAVYPREARVRNEAIKVLGRLKNKKYFSVFTHALNDSSNAVVSSALYGIQALDADTVLDFCLSLEKLQSGQVQKTISDIYADNSKDNKNEYFKSIIGKYGLSRNSILYNYGSWLKQQNESVILEGLQILQNYYKQCSDLNKNVVMLKVIKGIKKEVESNDTEKEKEIHKHLKSELNKFENMLKESVE